MPDTAKMSSIPIVLSKPQKAAAVAMGAFLMGALWRFRGEHGYGASWGLLTCGMVFSLLVFAIFGFRRKINFLLYSLTAAAFMLSTPGWGTLNGQITGILESGVYGDNGQQLRVYIHPLSGLFIMLCLGFGLAAVFAFLLGRFFSDRPYGWKDMAVVLTVYFAVKYVTRAALSPAILQLVQPQAVDLFALGLQKAGIAGTPWQVYLQHSFDHPWAKDIHGGRNYFTSINTISSAITSLAVWLTVRYGLKDKTGARVMLLVCAAFAFAITFADLSLFFANGGYRMEHTYDLLYKLSGWGMWEYFTGFFAGGLLMLIFVSLPFDRLAAGAGTEEPFTAKMPGWLYGLLNFVATLGLCFSSTLVRPIASRYEDTVYHLPLYAGLSAAFLIVMLLIAKKWGAGLRGIDFGRFCAWALPFFFMAHILIYMFAGTPDMQHFRHTDDIANKLVLTSFAVFWLTYPVIFRKGAVRRPKTIRPRGAQQEA